MVFSSLTFLYLFLPICLAVYFLWPSVSWRNWVLVVFSLLFYAWGEPVYVLLLVLSTVANYAFGRLMGGARAKPSRGLLVVSVAFNLGMLGFFKYAGFLVENLNLLGLSWKVPALALPIGISFYTFQALSYVVDIYRGDVAVQRSYRDFLLYVSLFPQLIAGPIVRYSEIEPQLLGRKTTAEEAFYGATRFCIGLGKKVLIANYAGNLASRMLDGDLALQTTVGAWLGVLMFTLQIYFDFSGYSDMAIGLGRIFGFRYSENFNLPYMATSIQDFWRRWHISLSSFFRDYVYIPLGGNRRHYVWNLLVTWALTGLWHGASWNFVLWGLYFFALLLLEKVLSKPLKRVPKPLRRVGTFLLVMMGWVLFYCTDLGRLADTFQVLFGQMGASFAGGQSKIVLLNSLPLLVVGLLGCTGIPRTIGLLFGGLCAGESGKPNGRQRLYAVVVTLFDLAILVLTTISLIGSSFNPFLYFRF